ncbi:MAG TPA: hypothetical protein VEI02_15275 [Planctomycetota bacterium]|nr:hypothetical protein [Planctomycetota bacterium]
MTQGRGAPMVAGMPHDDAPQTPAPTPLSEALVDYFRPMLEERAGPDAQPSLRRLLVTLAVRVWNDAVLAARGLSGAAPSLQEDLDKLSDRTAEALRAVAQDLADRKRLYFADDLRLVGRWELTADKGRLAFRCAPLLPPPAADASPRAPEAGAADAT